MRIFLFSFALFILVGCTTAPPPLPATYFSPTISSPHATPTPFSSPSPLPYPYPLSRPTQPVVSHYPAPLAPTLNPDPFFQLIDASFINDKQGWALGLLTQYSTNLRNLQVRTTQDGGLTWETLPDAIFPADDWPVGRITFINEQVGWAYGPDLYTTLDGGKNWSQTEISGDLITLVTLGTNALAVSQQYPQPDQCISILWIYSPEKGWTIAPSQPEFKGHEGQLSTNGQTVWLLQQDITFLTIYIQVSYDQGQTWAPIPVPAESAGTSFMLRASPEGALWLLARGVPATAMMDKILYVSPDNGITWEVRAGTRAILDSEKLPISGHATDLFVLSSSRVFLANGTRGLLYGTFDGGKTWQVLSPEQQERLIDLSGFGRVFFVDPLHGWATSPHYLFRTTDGGVNWEKIEIR